MTILDIITKQDLMKPPDIRDGRNHGGYNLSEHFIKHHGKAMGRRAGRWARELVEEYLNNFFAHTKPEQTERDVFLEETKKSLDQAIKRPKVTHISGKMQGRGGRVRHAKDLQQTGAELSSARG